MTRGRILNRPLRPEWLDMAVSIRRRVGMGDEARRQLEVALRDEPLATESRKKVVEAISHVWLKPGPDLVPFTDWAVDRALDVPDARAIHLVALLAAYPFFGDVCAAVGRLVTLDGDVRTDALRSRLRNRWGDREVVNVAQRKCVQTLRDFGVLTAPRGSSVSQVGEQLVLPAEMVPWAVHGLMLSRGIEALETTEVRSAPELFFLGLPPSVPNGYRYLERHSASQGRSVLVRRTELRRPASAE